MCAQPILNTSPPDSLGWQLGSCSTRKQEASPIPTELQALGSRYKCRGCHLDCGCPAAPKTASSTYQARPSLAPARSLHASAPGTADHLQTGKGRVQVVVTSMQWPAAQSQPSPSCRQHTHPSGSWAWGALLTPLSVLEQGPILTFTPASGA